MTNDYYAVLGCAKNASRDDLKRAYRKLALKLHPDKNEACRESTNLDGFRRLEEAWRILSDVETRKQYDAECRQAELESQIALVYATVGINELIARDDNYLTYPCRCGSEYCVNKDDVNERNCTVHVPCEECTFVIVIET